MKKLRKHLLSAKHEHLAIRYPGDLAGELLSPRRRVWQALWIAPLAAAIILLVIWMRPAVPNSGDSNPTEIAAISNFDETLFAVVDVPHMLADLDIAPTDNTHGESLPSFSEVSAPDMPSMPSFDFSSTESSTS